VITHVNFITVIIITALAFTVRDESDLQDAEKIFNPEFTHQVIGQRCVSCVRMYTYM